MPTNSFCHSSAKPLQLIFQILKYKTIIQEKHDKKKTNPTFIITQSNMKKFNTSEICELK